jgi:hypothetical protein
MRLRFHTAQAASIVTVVTLLLLGARETAAQVLPVQPGDSVRVSAPPYIVGTVPGRAVQVVSDSISIRFAGRTSPIWIPNASVQSVELWRIYRDVKKRTVTSTITGGIVGLAVGLAIGYYIAAAPRECTPSCTNQYGTLVRYGLYGIGTGAVVGLQVAGHISAPRWVSVFP